MDMFKDPAHKDILYITNAAGMLLKHFCKHTWELDINSLVPCWGTVRGVKKVPCEVVTPIPEGHSM